MNRFVKIFQVSRLDFGNYYTLFQWAIPEINRTPPIEIMGSPNFFTVLSVYISPLPPKKS